MKIRQKRSQEEMIGFVLIVVLVVVIAMIMLAFSIRNPAPTTDSKDVENFLQSSLLYTTNCMASQYEYYDLKGLVTACYTNQNCANGEDACEALENISSMLLDNNWNIGGDTKYEGYNFKIYSEDKEVFSRVIGNSSSSKSGAEVFIPYSGELIYLKLEVYH